MSDFWTAQLTARRIEDETGLTPAEQVALPLGEWSRLAYGRTPAQGALQALNSQDEPPQRAPGQDPAGVMAAQHPQHATEDPGVDFRQMSLAEYALVRDQMGVGRSQKEGKGIFDSGSASSQSREYADAARVQAGRTALSSANVVEPPRLEARYVRQDDLRDPRTAAQRFNTVSNSFSL